MSGKTVRVVPAGPADRPAVERLLRDYLREMSASDAGPEPDARGYPYLDLYWTEPDRRAFLIRSGDRIAGFALVNAWSPSGRSVDHAMAEFYIEPTYRRAGTGTRAAIEVIAGLPGTWEIGVLAAHGSARAFWTRVLEQMFGVAPEWMEGDGRRWSGQILRFRSTGRSAF